MCNWNNMERGAGRLHHQAFDHSDTDGTESCFISEAKADMKRPIPGQGTKRLQTYLQRVGY